MKLSFYSFLAAFTLTTLLVLSSASATLACSDLIISGVIDGDNSSGQPKAIELYVLNDIADLSEYSLESANNGAGPGTPEFTFPAVSANAGDYIYIVDDGGISDFNTYFGFSADYDDNNVASINGDDAIILYRSGSIVDVFGQVGTDGTGEPWEYTDGWAYRNSNVGPSCGNTFDVNDWTVEEGAFDGQVANNAAANPPMPIGSYSFTPAGVIPTMGQWAFFLFGLSLFTVCVVGIYNVRRVTA